jgi:hypothetical protein
MTFKPFCDNQIHTKENPKGYDCLIKQLEGHNCVCPYTPENIQFRERRDDVIVYGKDELVYVLGDDEFECTDFEQHTNFIKLLKKVEHLPAEERKKTLVRLLNSK